MLGSCCIFTYRSASLDPEQTPAAEFSKLTRQANVWQLALEPLKRREMQALVNETIPAEHQLSGEDRFRILELAEGNPLFAEELLKDGLEFGVSRRLPTSISTLFLQRLESFSSEGRFLLSQAAVIGKRFDAHLLAQVSKQSFEAILNILRTARELQIIVGDVELTSSYKFRHALVREALYEKLLAVEACTLHRRIAKHLEKLPESEDRTIELAYHWWAARDPAKAVRYNGAAAEIAAARFASESAVRYYDRALEFVADGTLIQADLRDRQARQLWALSQIRRANDVLELAFEYFERYGPVDRVAEIEVRFAEHHYWLGSRDHSVMWSERALEAMRDNKAHPKRAHCLMNLAKIKLMRGSLEEARTYTARIEESLFAAPLEQRASLFEWIMILAAESGEYATALAGYERFRSIFDKPEWEAFAIGRSIWQNVAVVFLTFGNLDIANYAVERARVCGLAHPELPMLAQQARVAVHARLLGGGFTDAAQLIREYWATHTSESCTIMMAPLAAALAARLLRPELLPEIAADEIVELAFGSGDNDTICEIAAAYAEWFATNDGRTRARELIARALTAIGDRHDMARLDGILAFALYGDAAAVRWAREMLAGWAAPASNRVGRAYLVLVDAIALGARSPRAAKLARAAAEGFREAGLPYYEALALERCGAQKQALEIYRRIGDERDTRRLAAEIDPMNSRGRRMAELTARETEIADLIADGKSNRVIAQRLVLSQRTVETHVASIFSKLEIRARGDIADRVAQRR